MAKKKSAKAVAETPPPDTEDDAVDEVMEHLPPPPAPASVPAKASCLTFIVLLLAEIVVLCLLWWNEQLMRFSLGWLALVTLLVFVIPIVVYRAVALWMFDESARYPDIAESWRVGVAELARHGMSLSSAPLFMIVGTGDDKLRRSFMNATGGEFFVDGACDVPSPIYWYANTDGIFLYLNDVSWMNAAVTLYDMHMDAVKSGRQLPGEQPRAGAAGPRKMVRPMGTLMPNAAPLRQPAPQPALPSDDNAAAAQNRPAEPARPAPKGAARYLGTIMPGQLMAPPSSEAVAPVPSPIAEARSTSAAGMRVANRLTSHESSQQLQRLEHLCGLLRRQRHPVCPVNGMLVLLPFEMLKAGDQDVAELERAVAADLATIYRELQLRCPVTAVVVGMDQEKGFRELIRRIGREDVAKQRFGQRFDVRTPATVEELRKFTSHVCGTFEDWVYTLFRDEQALAHPGNTALYAMLCKVRRTLKTRLGDVLGKGFGYDRQSGNIPILFSGCYFAATGPKSDRQAFVSGLLSKLYDEQEEIEWTEDALREDQRRGRLARIGWGVCALVLLAAGGGYFADKYFD